MPHVLAHGRWKRACRLLATYLCLFCANVAAPHAGAQPFLSNLSATRSDPLFTTYAAPLSRSEFVVDEGYRFNFDEENGGIDFETDTAGELALAFKLGDEVRYYLHQMHAEPVVTASYSDLVRYHYEPFPGIDVAVSFQVYSSRFALLDVAVTNETGQPVALDFYPFLHHDGGISEVAVSDDRRSFTFRHVERPDGWTTSHGVPYAADLRNVYLLSTPADAAGGYSDIGTVQTISAGKRTSFLAAQAADNYAVEWGLVHHADGSLCRHTPPEARQVIWHSDNRGEILTEDVPKWGDTDPNIPGNGYQGAELGNFIDPPIAVGDRFTVQFTCLATGQQGIAQGTITALPAPGGIPTDVQLQAGSIARPPDDVEITFSQDNTSAALQWTAVPGYTYSVYRRSGEPAGRYDRMATGISGAGYLDTSLDPATDYGYVVIAHDAEGNPGTHSREAGRYTTAPFFADLLNEDLSGIIPSGNVKVVAFQKTLTLDAGETTRLRLVRGVAEAAQSAEEILASAEPLLSYDMEEAIRENEALYSRIPAAPTADPDLRLVYWNAFSLLRQVMLPPEGSSSYNYYVFSREPTWGWGHGGQVFHESLAMLAYVYMDPEGAMNSQRVYFERQHDDGYINYRTGSFLDETIPSGDDLTTSAPWLNWENWELYRATGDHEFLREAYDAGGKFYEWWLRNRDEDGDGLAEWGGHAVLESVRDGQVAVWDQVGWPSNFEALDLNVMLVKEARSLAEMARALGDSAAALRWTQEADTRTQAVNDTFWDSETGFFYHVDRDDHDFTYARVDDLKRQEIIGFLPLWAGTATPEQAARLVEHLTDEEKFWRPYGVPTLAADDSYYNPMGYWNGPIWVQWQYLIFRGLLDYGYDDLAAQLAQKVLETVAYQLATSHTFWELYSPDDLQAGFHQTYNWTGLVARMMLDLEGITPIATVPEGTPAATLQLDSYPNPFRQATTITYALPGAGEVRIAVYDILGHHVANLYEGWQDAGSHTLTWAPGATAPQMATGMYFIQLEHRSARRTQKTLFFR